MRKKLAILLAVLLLATSFPAKVLAVESITVTTAEEVANTDEDEVMKPPDGDSEGPGDGSDEPGDDPEGLEDGSDEPGEDSAEPGDGSDEPGVDEPEEELSAEALASDVIVRTYQELVEAVATAEAEGRIVIAADIELAETLAVDKSLTFAAAGSQQTLYVARDFRHMAVSSADDSKITLTFENIQLDGRPKRTGSKTIGGGIHSSAELAITGGSFFGISCLGDGGAIHAEQAVTVKQSTIYRCEAGRGGAVYAAGPLTIISSTVDACSAEEGGAVFAEADLKLEKTRIQSSVALNSQSESGGGAICLAGSNATMILQTVEIRFNRTRKGNGGAILIQQDAVVDILGNCDFDGNGFANDAAADGLSGAIYTTGKVDLTLRAENGEKIQFRNNQGTDGAAIFCAGSDGSVTLNLEAHGGTILFEGNAAKNGCGGAIYTSYENGRNVKTTITAAGSGAVLFLENTAETAGGAIAQSGPAAGSYDSALDVVAKSGGTILFQENRAAGSEAVGGAVYADGSCTALFLDGSDGKVQFIKNKAIHGGAVSTAASDGDGGFDPVDSVSQLSRLAATGVTFLNNYADVTYSWPQQDFDWQDIDVEEFYQLAEAQMKDLSIEDTYGQVYNNADIQCNIGQRSYLVTFYLYEAGLEIHCRIMVKDGGYVSDPPIPTRPGKGFQGWYFNPYTLEDFKPARDAITENTAIYPRWSNYTVIYRSNGGTGNSYNSRGEEDGSHQIPHPKDIGIDPPAGCAFAGWKVRDGSDIYNPRKIIFPDGLMILEAQWIEGEQDMLIEPVKTYKELKQYLDALVEGDEVTVVVEDDIPVPGSDGRHQDEMLHIKPGVTVTLTDEGEERCFSFEDKPAGMFVVDEGGNLIVEGKLVFDGSYTPEDPKNESLLNNFGFAGQFITVYGKATIKGGTYCNIESVGAKSAAAIYVTGENASLEFQDGTIRDNQFFVRNMNEDGGSVGGYCAPIVVQGTGRIHMTGGLITNNTLTSPDSPGGVLLMFDSDHVTNLWEADVSFVMDGGAITENTAYYGGIGVHNNLFPMVMNDIWQFVDSYRDAVMTVEINKGLISDNVAHWGGGLAVRGNANITINDVEITGNTAAVGGGIVLDNLFEYASSYNYWTDIDVFVQEVGDIKFTFNGGQIADNKAYADDSWLGDGEGGGLYLGSCDVSLNKGIVTGNQSEIRGGGISLPYYGQAQIAKDFSIEKNRTEGIGGGIFLNGALTMNENHIAGNHASLNGGGVYVQSEGKLTAKASEIYDNKSDIHGGGLHVSVGETAKLEDVAVYDNQAGKNGGGIYLAAGELAIPEKVKIIGNTADNGGGIYLAAEPVLPKEAEVMGNAEHTSTGAIGPLLSMNHEITRLEDGFTSAEKAAASIEGTRENPVEIKSNIALLDGGGIYTHDYERLKLKYTAFAENKAQAAYKWELEEPPTEPDILNAQIHRKMVSETSYSDDFTNAYSNYDVNYRTTIKTIILVTYDPNGGNGSVITDTFVKGESYTLRSQEEAAFTRSGYTFLGWSASETGPADSSYVPGNVVQLDNNLTLYAVWSEDEVDVTVTYDPNGGSGSVVADTFVKGESYTIRSQEEAAFTRSGYTFLGWSASKAGPADSSYAPGKVVQLDNNLTLYAVWNRAGTGSKRNYEVSYEVSYHSKYTTDKVKESYRTGAVVTVNGQLFDYPDGVIFLGWSRQEGGDVDYEAGDTFNMPAMNVNLYAVLQTDDSWLNKDDHYAYIVGYPDGTVRPEDDITRAEVATIFFRLLQDDVRDQYRIKTNSFTDVKQDDWFNTAVSTLANMGVLSGYADGSFRPDAPITRAELAATAVQFDNGTEAGAISFTDISSHWAQDQIRRAAHLGWVEGYPDGAYRPDQNISRAEMMTLVNKVLDRHIASDVQMLKDAIIWPDNLKTKWYYYEVEEATNSHYYERDDSKEQWTILRPVRNWAELEH